MAEFAAGYLHQDFELDHASPEEALRAFLAEANDEERRALIDELDRFKDAATHATWHDVREAFTALGGAWRPRSRAALDELLHLPSRLAERARERRR
ncbi:MAG: contact-dependent growth inhibition system immunity protein [Vicinamibacterales bacterium]